MRLCEVTGCERQHKARGMCNRHYARANYGQPPREPDFVDDIAVELAAAGRRKVRLNRAERIEALKVMASRGVNPSEMSRRVGSNYSTVVAMLAEIRVAA